MNKVASTLVALLMGLALSLFVCVALVNASESPDISCQGCVDFWNGLRYDVGCNGNSTICNYIPVSEHSCQDMINAICAAGCQDDPSTCAYVACCAVSFCTGSYCPSNSTEIYF